MRLPSSAIPVSKICSQELPANVDLVFIGAFTEAAHTAYA